MVMCFVPDCKHYSERRICTFFRFPRDPIERKEWISLIRRKDKEPSNYALVCSCHFVDKNRKNGPTIFEHNKANRFPKDQFENTSIKKASIKQWLLACNRDDLLQKPINELCYYKVCENHFDKKYVVKGTARHHLYEEAVPSLFSGLKQKVKDNEILPASSNSQMKNLKNAQDIRPNNSNIVIEFVDVNEDSIAESVYEPDMESSILVDLTDVKSVCRICLQKSDNLVSIKNLMKFDNKNIHQITVLRALETIIGDKVELPDNFPHQICMQCENYLRVFITFKYTFNKATRILDIFVNEDCPENDNNQDDTVLPPEDNNTKQNSLESEVYCSIDMNTKNPYILYDNSESLSELVNFSSKTQDKLHTCPICWTKLSMSKLIHHVKSHKTMKKYLSIPKMSPKMRFYAPARDFKGLLSGEGEKLHKCPICRFNFKATEYVLHVHHHLTHDRFECKKCHRTFKKKSYLLSHMLIHNRDFPFRCETCKKGFVIKSNYECHLLTHEDGDLPHKCVECGKGFSNPKHLSRHMTIHTENRNYSTKYRYKRCKYCGEGFLQTEQLLKHVCHQYGLFNCQYCYKVFVNPRTRQIHTRTVHFKRNKKPGYCHVCNLMFKNIIYHKASKHPIQKSKALCTVCGLYVTNIYNHMRKHRNKPVPKSHQCPICSKLFSYRTTLHKHLAIHTGLKPYICTYCGKAFNCRYNLQVHERIHVGDRCYVCPLCDKGFLEKSYLNKHLKTHKDTVFEFINDITIENNSN